MLTMTEAEWRRNKRELADYGCFYDDEDEVMRGLRVIRARLARDRAISGNVTGGERDAADRADARDRSTAAAEAEAA